MNKVCKKCGKEVGNGYLMCPGCGGKAFSSVAGGAGTASGGGSAGHATGAPPKAPRKLLKPIMQVALLPRRAVYSILAGVGLLVVFLFAGTDWLAERTALSASLKEEQAMTEAARAQPPVRDMLAQALPDDNPTSRLVRKIGQDLVRSLPAPSSYSYEFVVVPAHEINAFALPGGLVVVFSGLIETLETPEELAAVLAHEIQHVEHRHGLKQHYKTLGSLALFTMLFGVAQDSGTLMGAQIMSMKYGRAIETEADIGGARLLARAGVSPKVMVKMLRKLDEIESGWTPTILRNHPKSGLRAKQIAAMPETAVNLPESNPNWND
jgi:predicted Zn-dependent protease